MMIPVNLIVCATKSNGIGQAGRLPWRLKEDMAFFKHVTTLAPPHQKNVVLMGRKTWESIPKNYRPLANRINIVISRTAPPGSLETDHRQDSYLVNSIDSACQLIKKLGMRGHDDVQQAKSNEASDKEPSINKVFVIGGAQLYKTFLDSQNNENQDDLTIQQFKPSYILLTRILSDHPLIEESIDTYFPEFRSNQNWAKSSSIQDQVDFLTLDKDNINREPRRFHFEQLIIEDTFIYEFELWKNRS